MTKYAIKRLLLVIPMVLAVGIIVFLLINAMPGDPGRRILGTSATQEQVDTFNERIGYGKPLTERLGKYVSDFVRLDFGKSYKNNQPVLEIILNNFPYTLKLVVMTTVVYVVLGVSLGVLSAVKQYTAIDNITRVVSISLAAFPAFWVYMIALLVFSLYLGLFPSSGATDWKCYVLPVGVGAILSASSLQRLTRTTMLEAIRQDYVRTAKAKGCAQGTVIWKHAFLNAMLPVLNQVGISFGYALGGTVITESIFGMPGLGTVIINAINSKDVPLVMGTAVFLALIFCVLVVLLDLLAAAIDPRVKVKLTKS